MKERELNLESMIKEGNLEFYNRDVRFEVIKKEKVVSGYDLELYKEQLKSEGLFYFFNSFFGKGLKVKSVQESTGENIFIQTVLNCKLEVAPATLLAWLKDYLYNLGISIDTDYFVYLVDSNCYEVHLDIIDSGGDKATEVYVEDTILGLVYKILQKIDFKSQHSVLRPNKIDEMTFVKFS